MRRSITAQFTLTFALVSAVVVAGFVVMTLAVRNLQSTDHQRAGSTRALLAADQLEQAVLDLETGLRGYLLAGRPVFLEPHRTALREYPRLAAGLEKATAGDPRAQALSRASAVAIGGYVEGWAAPEIHTAQRDLAAARRAEAAGAGKARVDAMRAQFTRLLDHEPRSGAGSATCPALRPPPTSRWPRR
ncbi:MAG: CHASE3 domain-containing protein [Solirubrobacteraceae bacterium]